MIEHSNIIYMPNISELGGIETYVYELVKKYKDLDIAVVSKRCDEKQAKRIRKYCRLYIHTNQKIKCDVALINYDQSIINYIEDGADIYQVIHADYTNSIYTPQQKPKPHPRIKAFIAITEFLKDRMSDSLKPNNTILCYNPLTVDKEKPIIIVSATRLHEHKGKSRMQKLASELDRVGVNYLWIVITGDVGCIDSPNVVFINNRLDISKWLSMATYVALLSDSEACSYTLSEALYRNIPILSTPLPYLKEIGVEDGKNAYIVEFDCSNISDVAKKITNVPKFEFNKMKDSYDKIFTDVKGSYQEYMKKKVKVKCIQKYFDIEENEWKVPNLTDGYYEPENHPNRMQWETNMIRAEELAEKGLVRIIDNKNKTN